MKKIMLITLVSILFVSCEKSGVDMDKFDYYFESGITPVEFQIGSGEKTLIVKKINAPVRLIAITELTSDTTHSDTVFEQDELANTVESNFTEVTISSNQVKIVVKANDAAYDINIEIYFTGDGVSKDAMMTMGNIFITQKAKQ